jgi:hypothetical protein
MLGEHSEELLRELGYSTSEIGAFVNSGVTRGTGMSHSQAAAE